MDFLHQHIVEPQYMIEKWPLNPGKLMRQDKLWATSELK
jgi:hypothetical protein